MLATCLTAAVALTTLVGMAAGSVALVRAGDVPAGVLLAVVTVLLAVGGYGELLDWLADRRDARERHRRMWGGG